MLTYACEKMSGGFADITGITAHTGKLVNHTRMKPAGDRVFHTKNGSGRWAVTTVKRLLSSGLLNLRSGLTYKINNTWLGLHEDITKLTEILKKNLFPAHVIEKVVNRYITGTHSNHCPRVSLPTTSPTFYFKLPYIGHFSVVTQKKIRHLIKRYCK